MSVIIVKEESSRHRGVYVLSSDIKLSYFSRPFESVSFPFDISLSDVRDLEGLLAHR